VLFFFITIFFRPRSAVCGARVDYLFFDATADGLPFLASGPHFSIFFAIIEKDGPQDKKIGDGSDMSTDTKRRKDQRAAVGSAYGRFYARGAKWTTFFGVTAADGLLFLASGPHSLIFFYTMDPKRKRSESGPHSGLHSGKKIRGTAASAVCGPLRDYLFWTDGHTFFHVYFDRHVFSNSVEASESTF